ncbi:uncharacterized protein LOC112576139 [Pomacea canaliculata]|uniref:uncharacterized protein LOC112576139 n=1 Tax=Pomacea canaliculata TaxID=400727 RepID=UPI000D7346FB|nr:uncharacterized protein LOC112576139 [Pomacea canaliculata]
MTVVLPFQIPSVSQQLTILLLCLWIATASSKNGSITCSIPTVELLHDANLTCHFPEDLSATKKDFSVYHYDKGVDSDAVLDCWWHYGVMECIQKQNVHFNRIVGRTLNLTFQSVTSNYTGIYACQVPGYDASYYKTCTLQVKIAPAKISQPADEHNYSLLVGLSVGVSLSAVLVIIVFLILRHKGIICNLESHVSQPGYEDHPMLQIEEEEKSQKEIKGKVEKNARSFDDYLKEEVLLMFPNVFEAVYFVPPFYFNKTRDTPFSVADQVVNVLQLPDPCDVRHDRAMQHVLNCLHYVAIPGVEQMFVLTQFKYTDYLKSIPEEFSNHLLPVSSLANEHEQDRSFDFLIIHRRYGVLVGVVKDCSSISDKRKSKIGTNAERVCKVSEVIEQLKRAGGFVTEAMSDKANFPKVRKVLVLFNCAQPTIESIPRINKNPSELWAISFKTLPDCLEPDFCQVKQFKEEWDNMAKESQDSFTLNDQQYLEIIGRFCGPATTPILSMESKSYQLPKTFSHAVSLTGEIFERNLLIPKLTELLNEPFLFLAGPPGTGKTRILGLVGRKWVLEGHPVHIISTSPGGKQAARHLKHLISSTVSSVPVKVFHIKIDLGKKKSIEKQLDTLEKSLKEAYIIAVELNFQMKHGAKRILAPAAKLVLYGRETVKATVSYVKSSEDLPTTITEFDIDNTPPTGDNIQRKKRVQFLFKDLRRRFPNLHMWGAGCTELDLEVPDLRVEFLTECLSCPPSVRKEACEKNRVYGVGKHSENQYPVPTSGPPVKHFYHQGQGHFKEHPPQECTLCTKDMISFLIHDLCIKDESTKADVTQQEIQANRPLRPAPIQYNDILIFFESDVNNSTPMVKSLVAEGIPVTVINHPNQSTEVRQEKNSVLVAKSSLYLGYRRKVVVFVEGDTDSNDIIVRWNRLRCWTCCTSQLILVHNVKT